MESFEEFVSLGGDGYKVSELMIIDIKSTGRANATSLSETIQAYRDQQRPCRMCLFLLLIRFTLKTKIPV